MSIYDLYKKMCRKNPLCTCKRCLDFGDFYIFFMVPIWKDTDDYVTGTIFEAIRKENGEIFEYDITSDADAYFNAKEIPLNSLRNGL